MQTFSVFPLLIGTLALLAGCSNQPVINKGQNDLIMLENQKVSSESELALAEAESLYEQGIAAELNFYSPANMSHAKRSLLTARNQELNGLSNESLSASKEAISSLNQANANKAQVEKELQPVLAQKAVLDELNCPLVLPAAYNLQLAKIKSLIRQMESQDNSIDRSTLDAMLTDLQQLELDTLLAIHWQPAKNTLVKAKAERAHINAPTSFKLAKDQVAQTKADITNNIKNLELVAASGTKALRTAQHAIYIARDAELLDKLTKKQAETAALEVETLLLKISTALNIDDVRHMSLLDQANAIAQAAETQARRLTAPLKARISELEQQRSTTTPSATTQ